MNRKRRRLRGQFALLALWTLGMAMPGPGAGATQSPYGGEVSGNFGAGTTTSPVIPPGMMLVVQFRSGFSATLQGTYADNGKTDNAFTGVTNGTKRYRRPLSGGGYRSVTASAADSNIVWDMLPDASVPPFDQSYTIGSVMDKPFATVSSLTGGGADYNGLNASITAVGAIPTGGGPNTPAKGGDVYWLNDGIHGVTTATGILMPNTNNITLRGANGAYIQAQAAMTTGILNNVSKTQGHIIESLAFDENNYASYGVYWVTVSGGETSLSTYWLDVWVYAGQGATGGLVPNADCFHIGTYNDQTGYEDMVWIDCVAAGDTLTGTSWNYQIPFGEGSFIHPKCYGKPFVVNAIGIYMEGSSIVALVCGGGNSVSTAGNANTQTNVAPNFVELHNVQITDTGLVQAGTLPAPRAGDAAIPLTNLPCVTLGVFDSVNTRLGSCEGGIFDDCYWVVANQTTSAVSMCIVGMQNVGAVANRIGNGPGLHVRAGHFKLNSAIPATTINMAGGTGTGTGVMTITSGTGFPASGYINFETEIVHVASGGSGTAWTVDQRGVGGTTAVNHANGAQVGGSTANPTINVFLTLGSSSGTIINDGLHIQVQSVFGTGAMTDLSLGAASTTQIVHQHLILTGSRAVTSWTPTGQNANTGVAFTAGGANHQNVSGRLEHWAFNVKTANTGNSTSVVITRGKASGGTDFQNDTYIQEVSTTSGGLQFFLALPPGEWASITITGGGSALTAAHVVLA